MSQTEEEEDLGDVNEAGYEGYQGETVRKLKGNSKSKDKLVMMSKSPKEEI